MALLGIYKRNEGSQVGGNNKKYTLTQVGNKLVHDWLTDKIKDTQMATELSVKAAQEHKNLFMTLYLSNTTGEQVVTNIGNQSC